jgi:hypothetical protein
MPLAFGPLSRRPISVLNDLPLVATIAAAANATIIYTAEITTSAGVTVNVATQQYSSLISDSRPSIAFNCTLDKAPSFKWSIKTGAGFGGISSGFGPLNLKNARGEYDWMLTTPMDGALVVVKMGWPGISYDRFVPLVYGLVDGKPVDDGEILTINFKDDNKRLEIPALPNVYGGTGGIDGDANVKGKRKQLAFGPADNVTCNLIDSTNLVYQFSDGASYGVSHCYDRRVELSVNAVPDYPTYAALIGAGAVAAGKWATCLALSVLRLGSKPDGLVTVNLVGGAVSNGLVAGSPVVGTALTDTASIIHYLITNSGANLVVDTASILAVKAAQPAPIAYVINMDDNKTLRQALGELTDGVGGFGGFRSDRSFNLGIFTLPTGAVVGDFTQNDWYGKVTSVALPSSYAVPPKRVFIAWGRNWTIQSDIDATVDAGTATLVKDPYSIAVSNDTVTTAAIVAANQNAADSDVIPSFFANESDAITEGNRALVLKGAAARRLLRVDLNEKAFVVSPGMVERLTDTSTLPRYGLGTPKPLTVVEIDNGFENRVISVEGFC